MSDKKYSKFEIDESRRLWRESHKTEFPYWRRRKLTESEKIERRQDRDDLVAEMRSRMRY